MNLAVLTAFLGDSDDIILCQINGLDKVGWVRSLSGFGILLLLDFLGFLLDELGFILGLMVRQQSFQ